MRHILPPAIPGPPGRHELLYVMRDPARSIDVGGQRLEQVALLARWWGIAIKTRSLGYGGYRIQLDAQGVMAA